MVMDISCSLLSSAFYAGMLLTGLPEVVLACLVTQVLLELKMSREEFNKGRQIEGYGHFALSLVRALQAIPSAKITYVKWLAPKRDHLKIVSFNILSDTTLGWFGDEVAKRPDDFSWAKRIERIYGALRSMNADVICLQEVEPKSYEYLKQKLGPSYASRLDLNENKKFGCATFVKKSSVDITRSESLFYPGTTGRIAQVVDLKTKEGKVITVANTHLDQPTRAEQMKNLVNYLQENRGNQERIVCGDWNAKKTDDVFEVLKKSGYFFDPKESPTNTHQNTELKQIDGIAHTKGVHSTARAWKDITLETVLPSKEIASDHVPLIGSLSWQSLAQASAAKYRQISCFFHMYWNSSQNDLRNAT